VSHGILRPMPVKIQDRVYISEQESAASARCINRGARLIKGPCPDRPGFLKLNVSMWDAILELSRQLLILLPTSPFLFPPFMRSSRDISRLRTRFITGKQNAAMMARFRHQVVKESAKKRTGKDSRRMRYAASSRE